MLRLLKRLGCGVLRGGVLVAGSFTAAVGRDSCLVGFVFSAHRMRLKDECIPPIAKRISRARTRHFPAPPHGLLGIAHEHVPRPQDGIKHEPREED
ncbi:MAG: hypothetical protein RL088_2567 [Verrucomicrobiota bacterium]|jgi:hypothetical protein